MRRLISFSGQALFFSALLPAGGLAGPIVVPSSFREESFVIIEPTLDDRSSVTNRCAGVPVLCESAPTSASVAMGRTRASAATDGNGGSELGLSSEDSNIRVVVKTTESGSFEASSDVEVRMLAFFPEIELRGVFSEPESSVTYRIHIVMLNGLPFATGGVLTADGFTVTGTDIGAIFNPGRHTVTVPPFLFDRVLGTRSAGDFFVDVEKSLVFEGTNGVETARASIVDPFGVGAPGLLRNGLVFTPLGSAPEPGTLLLFAGGLVTAFGASRRRR